MKGGQSNQSHLPTTDDNKYINSAWMTVLVVSNLPSYNIESLRKDN